VIGILLRDLRHGKVRRPQDRCYRSIVAAVGANGQPKPSLRLVSAGIRLRMLL